MAVETPICDFGWTAPDFALPGVDGRSWRLADIKGERGVLVMFICNHCPYVRSVIDRIVRDAKELQAMGIGVAAISSNDAATYPEDSFDNMKRVAAREGFTFPYLYDESQDVARAYDAACTPDFYVFDKNLRLAYRGCLDGSRPGSGIPLTGKDLRAALDAVLAGKPVVEQQYPSAGCNIKWKGY